MTRQMGYSDVIFDIDSITVQNFITSKSHICFPPVFGSFGFAQQGIVKLIMEEGGTVSRHVLREANQYVKLLTKRVSLQPEKLVKFNYSSNFDLQDFV